MSSDGKIILNPLQRDGVNQQQRLIQALQPNYAKIDDRDLADCLMYIRKYAELLRFYNPDNRENGDWVNFIEKDITTLVAIIWKEDVEEEKKSFVEQLEALEIGPDLSEHLADLFSNLVNFVDEMHAWRKVAIPGLKVYHSLETFFNSLLSDSTAQLLSWLDWAYHLAVPLETKGIDLPFLMGEWKNQPALDPTQLPVSLPGTDGSLKNLKQSLITVANPFFQVAQSLKKQAPAFLEETLTSFPRHEPHMGLYLAFLQLFKLVQEHLNELTEAHLNFYYKDVLRLAFRPEDPDEVHLIFELAKKFPKGAFEIEQHTRFPAGKDINNIPRTYASDDLLTVNRATIDEAKDLKSVYIRKKKDEEKNSIEIVNIYAAPQAASSDGLGEALTTEDGKWETFGTSDPNQTPYASVGFAVSSPMLLLEQGERVVTITFKFEELQSMLDKYGRSVVKSELKNNIRIYLSGEEEWILIEESSVDIVTPELTGATATGDEGDIQFQLFLSPDVLPVLPYNAKALEKSSEEVLGKALEKGFDTSDPMALFVLDNEGLSTLGNLDLSLAAGIQTYDSEENQGDLFLGFEFVSFEQAEQICIFRANGDVIGQDPDSQALLWQVVDLGNVSDTFNPNSPYNIGDLIELGDVTFRANAHILGIGPSDNKAIWIEEDLGDQNTDLEFDPEEGYTLGQIVIFDDILYEIIISSKDPIAPSSELSSSKWEKIATHQLQGYPAGRLVQAGSNYFRANVDIDNAAPFAPGSEEGNKIIWRLVTPFESNPALARRYETEEASLSGGDVYKYKAGTDGISLGTDGQVVENEIVISEPNLQQPIWEFVPPFTLGTHGYEEIVGHFSDNKVYQQNVDSTSMPPNNTDVIWATVDSYVGGHSFNDVVANSNDNKIYRQNVDSTLLVPNPNDVIWSTVTIFSGNLSLGSIVAFSGDNRVYQQNVDAPANPPNPNDVIWARIATHSSGHSFGQFVGLVADRKIYQQNVASTILTPGGGETIWNAITPHSSGHSFNQIVGHASTNTVYQQNVTATTLAPGGSETIWNAITSHSSGHSFNDIVGHTGTNTVYRQNVSATTLDPGGSETIWNAITPHSTGHGFNDIVGHAGTSTVYRQNVTATTLVPGGSETIWNKLGTYTGPTNVPDFVGHLDTTVTPNISHVFQKKVPNPVGPPTFDTTAPQFAEWQIETPELKDVSDPGVPDPSSITSTGPTRFIRFGTEFFEATHDRATYVEPHTNAANSPKVWVAISSALTDLSAAGASTPSSINTTSNTNQRFALHGTTFFEASHNRPSWISPNPVAANNPRVWVAISSALVDLSAAGATTPPSINTSSTTNRRFALHGTTFFEASHNRPSWISPDPIAANNPRVWVSISSALVDLSAAGATTPPSINTSSTTNRRFSLFSGVYYEASHNRPSWVSPNPDPALNPTVWLEEAGPLTSFSSTPPPALPTSISISDYVFFDNAFYQATHGRTSWINPNPDSNLNPKVWEPQSAALTDLSSAGAVLPTSINVDDYVLQNAVFFRATHNRSQWTSPNTNASLNPRVWVEQSGTVMICLPAHLPLPLLRMILQS